MEPHEKGIDAYLTLVWGDIPAKGWRIYLAPG